jgi:hypothetical protein
MQNNNDICESTNNEMDDIYNSIEDKFIEDELSVYFEEKRVLRIVSI